MAEKEEDRWKPGSVWFTVYLVEFIVIFTINAFTPVAFAKRRQVRKRTTYLIINLTVADLLVGALSGPLSTFISLGNSFNWLGFFIGILDGLFPIASVTNLSFISLERLHATLYPFRHCLISKWVYFKIVVGSWLLALIIACMMIVLEMVSVSQEFGRVSYTILNLLIITVSCIIITEKVKRKPAPAPFGAVASHRKMSVTLFIVCAVSLLSIIPLSITLCIQRLKDSHSEIVEAFQVLFYANSLVNPLIYAIRMQEFRKAVKELICGNTAETRRVQPPIELGTLLQRKQRVS